MITITIDKPYMAAWIEFGWAKGVWGFGFKKGYLDGPGEIKIISKYHKGRVYFLDKEQAKKECRIAKNKPNGVILEVVPMTLLEEEEKRQELEIPSDEPKPVVIW